MSITEKLSIEDTFADILGKARKGLKLGMEELAERSALTAARVEATLNGEKDEEAIEKLAFTLNLDAPSLLDLAMERWYPQQEGTFDGFAMFTTWYGDMTVNAFLVWDPETRQAMSFDTGSSSEPMQVFIHKNGLKLKKIFITHTHPDHLADLEALQESAPEADSYGSAAENPLGLKPLSHGDGLVLGKLRIRVLGTAGHTPGGLSYFVQGLEKPLVVSGDALFAGSQGGAAYAYQQALQNNRQYLLTLPENTVLCPGHGPLSTIGEEQAHNPFFPELKMR